MAADHYTYHRAADHFHRSSSAQCVPMEQQIIRQKWQRCISSYASSSSRRSTGLPTSCACLRKPIQHLTILRYNTMEQHVTLPNQIDMSLSPARVNDKWGCAAQKGVESRKGKKNYMKSQSHRVWYALYRFTYGTEANARNHISRWSTYDVRSTHVRGMVVTWHSSPYNQPSTQPAPAYSYMPHIQIKIYIKIK